MYRTTYYFIKADIGELEQTANKPFHSIQFIHRTDRLLVSFKRLCRMAFSA